MKTEKWNPNCKCGGRIIPQKDLEPARRTVFGKRQQVLIGNGTCDTCKKDYELIYVS